MKSLFAAAALIALSATGVAAQNYVVVTPGNAATYEMPDSVSLDLLVRARILDATGAEIGHVNQVLGDGAGHISAVAVALTTDPSRAVIVPYNDLRPAMNGNELVFTTSLGAPELQVLPVYR